MKIGETINIPVVTEQVCEHCCHKMGVYQMFENLIEPAEDEIGLPEPRVKCPYCGEIINWQIEFTT
jgi:predicted  nucleic acid-binding Zn-ribbon protein